MFGTHSKELGNLYGSEIIDGMGMDSQRIAAVVIVEMA